MIVLPDANISRKVRPGILIWFTILISTLTIIDGNFFGIKIQHGWIDLIETLATVVFTFYFVGKSYEHGQRMIAEIKYKGESYDKDRLGITGSRSVTTRRWRVYRVDNPFEQGDEEPDRRPENPFGNSAEDE